MLIFKGWVLEFMPFASERVVEARA